MGSRRAEDLRAGVAASSVLSTRVAHTVMICVGCRSNPSRKGHLGSLAVVYPNIFTPIAHAGTRLCLWLEMRVTFSSSTTGYPDVAPHSFLALVPLWYHVEVSLSIGVLPSLPMRRIWVLTICFCEYEGRGPCRWEKRCHPSSYQTSVPAPELLDHPP